MSLRKFRRLAVLIAGFATCGIAFGGEPSPEPAQDEKCVEQCDTQSDKCMQDSGGDPDKMKACDDKYSDCLQACPG